MPKWETDSPPMVSGNGAYSYYNNSSYQRKFAICLKEKIDEVIDGKLDLRHLPIASNAFHLADLGCSIGPNTFFQVQDLLEAIKRKYQCQYMYTASSQIPEFQVYFNDQSMNDFNTLFASLPQERQYFAAGVPGSFYGRLFPKSSLHFAHCSISLHWLSRVPEELLDRNSQAWNRGRVHYTNAADQVFDAYSSQFAKDMTNFLNARSEELVTGGIIIIVTLAIPDGMPFSELPNSLLFDCIASSLMDMVKEGLITEAQVDSFNVPFYTVSPSEMTELIETNGFFSIEIIELTDPAAWLKGPINIKEWVVHVRAAMEELFSRHFGKEIVGEIFDRLIEKLREHSQQLESKYREKTLLFLALKRK